MTFDDYQEQAGETAIYPNRGSNLVYPVLGLTGESGEVAEKVKKLIRDHGAMSAMSVTRIAQRYEFREAVAKELGDVLWYIAAVCHECGLRMEAVAEMNLAKLAARKQRGALTGSGDSR